MARTGTRGSRASLTQFDMQTEVIFWSVFCSKGCERQRMVLWRGFGVCYKLGDDELDQQKRKIKYKKT